ncbi:MAG: ABC transporter substrate-binding protein, partial [Desulfurococcaceae archaeon]
IIDEAFVLEGVDWAKSMELYAEAAQKIFNNAIAINLWDMMHIYVYDGGKLVFREEAFNPLYSYVIFFQYVEVKT